MDHPPFGLFRCSIYLPPITPFSGHYLYKDYSAQIFHRFPLSLPFIITDLKLENFDFAVFDRPSTLIALLHRCFGLPPPLCHLLFPYLDLIILS